MKKKFCCECKKALTKDEVALSKKLIDIDTEEFYCLPCMAADLYVKIKEFKEQGCTLFL